MADLTERIAADVLEAQRFSRKHFVLEFNFSDHSVHELEGHVDAVDYTLRGGKSPENVELLMRLWGSYLGEVIRRRCGGEWVTPSPEDETRLALRLPQGDLYPHEQVRRRLLEGAAWNLERYVQDACRTA